MVQAVKISSEKGFSLIEMIIAIAELGITLAIATPNFMAWRQNTNLREAARDISSDISLYKQRAVAENIRYQIVFNQGANNYTVNVENPAGSGFYTPLVPAVTKSPADEGRNVIINNITHAGQNITLQPRGTMDAGAITLQHAVRTVSTATITTNITGRVYVGYNIH